MTIFKQGINRNKKQIANDTHGAEINEVYYEYRTARQN
jgi:hypothetical protein